MIAFDFKLPRRRLTVHSTVLSSIGSNLQESEKKREENALFRTINV